jgi:hypothetical protein
MRSHVYPHKLAVHFKNSYNIYEYLKCFWWWAIEVILYQKKNSIDAFGV